ncbi:ABC transporter permease [Cytophagaceae bacterium YF14B1]|uniref:Transport permease protein n=1 Tax=Xanthocytophaga flava TaxID=3048013 RepID=A0AAE3QPB1_9BACT|nr:ABC transporter permease [Xanthocytophaga flavus]MDJ1482391.1 ABC transporter permease [Xanthocytophaga flavus]
MSKLIIDANRSNFSINFKELFAYRDLFFILAYRDLRVRYAQTFLGVLWAVIQPLFTLIIFTIVFGKAIGVSKDIPDNIPYTLYAACGMSAWTYFAFVMNQAGNSIIGAQGMIQKIYFPRLIIPLSKAIVGFVDFGVSFLFILVLMLWHGVIPSGNILFLPFYIFMTILTALAVGIWLSALTIRYRDFQQIVPFMVQFGLYATPIAYPTTLFNEDYRWLFYLNPMTGVVEGFRWSLLGTDPPNPYSWISFGLTVGLFISALYYFRRVERVMADIV